MPVVNVLYRGAGAGKHMLVRRFRSGCVIHISNCHRKRYAALDPFGSGTFAQGRFTLALDSKNFLIPAENLVQLHDNDASSHKPLD
jgi:hypothetical protein